MLVLFVLLLVLVIGCVGFVCVIARIGYWLRWFCLCYCPYWLLVVLVLFVLLIVLVIACVGFVCVIACIGYCLCWFCLCY